MQQGSQGCPTPIIYIEVEPLHDCEQEYNLCAAFVKDELLRLSCTPLYTRLTIEWIFSESQQQSGGGCSKLISQGELHVECYNSDASTGHARSSSSRIYLSQQHPCSHQKIPCRCTCFGFWDGKAAKEPFSITEATLIRVITSNNNIKDSLESQLCGESPSPPPSPILQQEVLRNHSTETIEQLAFRLDRLISKPVLVGTTADSLILRTKCSQNKARLRETIANLRNESSKLEIASDENITIRPQNNASLFDERALIIHSPEHGAGKTLLAETVARNYLNCSTVWKLGAGAILAKYGTQADSALETILHGIFVQAAAREETACIVIDGLEAFVSPSLSASTGTGDAAVPVLNATLSLLQTLTSNIASRNEVPFPSKNVLYNHGGRHGCVLKARVCLLATVTCPDGGWQNSAASKSPAFTMLDIFDTMKAGRFRLHPLSAETRLSAFQASLALHQLRLSSEAEHQLPFLAASALWAYGNSFSKVAEYVASHTEHGSEVSCGTLQQALLLHSTDRTQASSEVEFLTGDSNLFDTIGGNQEAKLALRESLSLDPTRRKLLASYGVDPPSGVLLYGPPGTGKTMLAKSVARLLNSSSTSVGGAFISLRISDVVLAEIGSSEKLVLNAFETARLNSPSVVFIDEFQALFTDRTKGGSSRLTSTLLECMDDTLKLQQLGDKFTNQEKKRVIVLAATNTPWMIDPSFLRPGRFDKLVKVDLPTDEDRKEILKIHLDKMQLDKTIDPESLMKKLVESTEAYSGADLAALCRSAAVQCLVESKATVQSGHFEQALDGRKSSRNQALVDQIRKWRQR